MSSRICRSCHRPHTGRKQRCEACLSKVAAITPTPTSDPPKQRDPIYGTALWQKIQKQRKTLNPLCQDCLDMGIVKQMQMVDHVVEIKDGGSNTLDNTRSLCWRHHAIKTAKERKKRLGNCTAGE